MLYISIADPLPYFPYYILTYVPFGFVPLVLVIRAHSPLYDRLYHGIVHVSYSMYDSIFSSNIRACASVHSHTIIRNVCVYASASICVHASATILAHTSVCQCVSSCASKSICAHAPAIICARGGCSACISVFMSNSICYLKFYIFLPC